MHSFCLFNLATPPFLSTLGASFSCPPASLCLRLQSCRLEAGRRCFKGNQCCTANQILGRNPIDVETRPIFGFVIYPAKSIIMLYKKSTCRVCLHTLEVSLDNPYCVTLQRCSRRYICRCPNAHSFQYQKVA